MQSQFYKRLIQGFTEKTLTKEELAIFMDLLSQGELDHYMNKELDAEIEKQLATKKPVQRLGFVKYAAVLVLIGFAAYQFLGDSFNQKISTTPSASPSVLPGYEHAILRMADGTELLLDTLETKEMVTDNGIVLSKKDGKGLVYDLSSLKQIDQVEVANQYSSIETPKGATYQLILSDGTKVWLNASSKLKFPLLFNGDERLVETEGEVYFEVAPNKLKPFIVKSRNQEIKVLGTSFNVNSYANEKSINTTLLEGSIALRTTFAEKIIKPGEQSMVNTSGISIRSVNSNQVLAWKEGYFIFDKFNVSEIMRQVERWYNVDVVYDGNFKDERFVGKIKRSASIAALIDIFNEGGLKVTLQARKLHVSNTN